MRREARDWRVSHRGRGSLDYEELRDRQWQRLTMSGEAGVERPRFVIYFGSRADWASRPDWARGRRDEILARIKQACPIPDYGYEGEAVLDAHDAALLIEQAGCRGMPVGGLS